MKSETVLWLILFLVLGFPPLAIITFLIIALSENEKEKKESYKNE